MEKYTETRPWGQFEQFTLNEMSTVKIITVKPNSELSYQFHNKRNEMWRVITGEGEVILDGEVHEAIPGKEFFIPKLTKHRMRTKDKEMHVMEISFGHFDENDIVRLEDKYNRK